jgi:hypothetical protein
MHSSGNFLNRFFATSLACVVLVVVTLVGLGSAHGRPGGRPPAVNARVVVGTPPVGWVAEGPGWYVVPTRDDLLWEPAASGEWRMVHEWIEGCVARGRVSQRMVDPLEVLAVMRLEEYLGIPWDARGILAAVWCMEASMRTVGRKGGPVRGDWRNGVARAHGPAQLWPWFREWCGFGPRGADNLYGALTCYWSRVADRHHYRNTSRCSNPWRVAEALAANGPRYLPMGCDAESSHWREMLSWR